jgi:hypothetical protein
MSRRAAGALMVVMAFALPRCGRPPLRVTTQPGTVVIDMQKLGEYPSDVARVRLTDAGSNRIVWEVKGRGEPQLGRVQLSVGENAAAIADVRHGSYDVLAPAGAGTFKLETGKRYVVEVWGKDNAPRTKRQAEFVVPSV